MAAVGAAMIMNEHRERFDVSSVASNGAAARIGIFYVNRDARLKSVIYTPTGADYATATGATASYRRLTVVNGGTAGTGTTVLASLNPTASVASWGSRAFTLATTSATDTSATVASGGAFVISHSTVGGDLDDGTILRAGVITLVYESI